ncbi:MAG: Wzz/FepE/Etk N-terminal domain-containing protein [Candidatus Omnitrophota bacterium]|nr:hypothetical protein [bacterium]MBU3929139.1 hypothetical protein [bacterium]
MTQDDRMEDEIDLGRMFMTLWEKRSIIAFCTAAFFIAGLVFALILPKIYESSSMLMIIPSKMEFIKNPLDTSLSLDLSGKSKSSSYISVADHLALMTAGDIAESIVAAINAQGLTASGVAGMLYPERIKDTSMIKLAVKGRVPELCARVADAWSKVYMSKAIAMISGETEASQSFLYSELKKAEAEMVAEERKLSELSIKNNIDLKSSELEVKKAKLESIQTAIIGNEKKLKIQQIRLTALKNEIKKHKQYKSMAKAVADDVLWDKIIEGKDLSAVKGQKIYSEELNPIYRKLESEIAEVAVDVEFLLNELNYLKSEKEILYKDVYALETKVAELKIIRDESSRAHTIAKTRYNSLFSRITEVSIASAAKLGDIKIISKAVVPDSPVSPKKKKIAGVAAAAGFFMGIAAAFAAGFIEKQKFPA